MIDPKLKALMDPDFSYDSDENRNGAEHDNNIHVSGNRLEDFDINHQFEAASPSFSNGPDHVGSPTKSINASIEPDPDARYLNNNGTFHYTSQFQARIHADKFDFYQGPEVYSHGRSVESRNGGHDEGHESGRYVHRERHSNENCEQGGDGVDDHSYAHYSNESYLDDEENDDRNDDEGEGYESGSDVSEEYEHQLHDMLHKVKSFKKDFRQLILKLDEASLESAKARYHYLNDINIRENMFMSTTTDMLLDTVAKLIPKRSAKYHSTQQVPTSHKDSRPHSSLDGNNAKISRTNQPRDSLTTLSNISLEDDPCSKLTNFGVVLIKSPSSVEQLWDEYTRLPADSNMKDLLKLMLQQQNKDNIRKSDIPLLKQRKTTIQELEKKYGSSWRNNDKNFSRQINRRKKIWGCIEEGLKDGLSLHTCFHILDKYVEERGKGLSWYYNGVPFKLSEIAPSYNLE